MNTKRVEKFYTDNEHTIDSLSAQYSIPIQTILAILVIETNDDDGYSPNGKLIIRFEAHKFFKYAPNKVAVKNHFRWDEKKPWTKQVFRRSDMDTFQRYHGNQAAEYEVFRCAQLIDEIAAYKSISMGLPQIMGFNYKKAGFNSAEEMYRAFWASIEEQLNGMFAFFGTAMKKYLREDRFFEFARLYNGEGKAATYAKKIAEAKISIESWLLTESS